MPILRMPALAGQREQWLDGICSASSCWWHYTVPAVAAAAAGARQLLVPAGSTSGGGRLDMVGSLTAPVQGNEGSGWKLARASQRRQAEQGLEAAGMAGS